MELYPAGILALVIWLVAALRDGDRALTAAIVVLPLGMLAAIRFPIGGFTPPLAHLFLSGAIALAIATRFVNAQPRVGFPLPMAAIPLLIYAVWGVFSAVVLVRLFAGDILVFDMDRGTQGARISPFFNAGLTRLAPGASNISQTAYMLLSVAFFLLLADLTRRLGIGPLVRALRVAALLNLLLGLLDAVALDALLEPLRTADYALHNEHRIAGIPRIIGGFAEASVFGSFSVAVGAFFLVRGHDASDPRDVAIGLANLAFALLALSSTAMLGFGVLVLCLLLRRLRRFSAKVLRTRALISFVAVTAGLSVLVVAGSLLIDTGEILSVLDKLVFAKAETQSGLERGAMAAHGFQIMVDTHGMGAGIGSARANGWLSATAAAVGVPGILLMLAFLATAFVSLRGDLPVGLAPERSAAQIGGIVAGAIACASSFVAYPELILIVFAAIATGTLTAPQPALRAATDGLQTLTPSPARA